MPTPAELLRQQQTQQAQANQAKAGYQARPQVTQQPANPFGWGSSAQTQTPNYGGYSAWQNAQRQANQTQAQIPGALAAQNRNESYDIARAGVNRMANDPADQFIRQRLQSMAGPGGGPYDETTRNAMFTQQSGMAGHAAGQAGNDILAQAAERGLSANDPGVQAALARVKSQQGQANQRARLGIDLEANRANYAAQNQAVNQFAGYNQSQGQLRQSAEDRLRQMLMNERFSSGPGAPDYSSYIR